MNLPDVMVRFLAGVEARDVEAVVRCFCSDATYWFAVPAVVAHGSDAIAAGFARVLVPTSRVRWDIVAQAVDGDRVWLERVDRFWFGEAECPIECTGVFELDGGLIREVRDYCDLAVWRERRAALPSS